MHTSGSHRRPSYLLNASPLYSNSAQLKTTNKLGDVVLFLFNMRFSSRTLIGVKKKTKVFFDSGSLKRVAIYKINRAAANKVVVFFTFFFFFKSQIHIKGQCFGRATRLLHSRLGV